MPGCSFLDLTEYLALFSAIAEANGGFPREFVFDGWNPLNWRIGALRRLIKTKRACSDLLATQFYSATPYLLGPNAIKFSVRPQSTKGAEQPVGTTPDFLRERLVATLAQGTAEFDVLVQLQTDPKTMPIEDPTVDWDNAPIRSPWRKVATLRMLSQNPASDERLALGKELAFDPWHTLPEHRPLGGINRARRAIYHALAADRHAKDVG